MHPQGFQRTHGTHSMYVQDKTWLGEWYVGGEPVGCSLGPIRPLGGRRRLIRTQADPKNGDDTTAAVKARLRRADGLFLPALGSGHCQAHPAIEDVPATLQRAGESARQPVSFGVGKLEMQQSPLCRNACLPLVLAQASK